MFMRDTNEPDNIEFLVHHKFQRGIREDNAPALSVQTRAADSIFAVGLGRHCGRRFAAIANWSVAIVEARRRFRGFTPTATCFRCFAALLPLFVD